MWQAIKFTLKKAWQISPALFLFYLTTQIFLAFSSLVNVFTFKAIVDSISQNSSQLFGLSLPSILFLRLCYELVKKLVEGTTGYISAKLDAKQSIFFNQEFVDKVASLDLSSFENPTTVGLIQRAFSRIQIQFKTYLRSIVYLIADLVEISVIVAIFFFASPLLAVAIIFANSIPIIVARKLSFGVFLIYRADDETKRRYGYVSQLIQERESLPEIKVNQAFSFFKKQMVSIYNKFTSHQLQKEKRYQYGYSLSEFIPVITLYSFTILMSIRFINGSLSAGDFMLLFTNIFAFSGALDRSRPMITNLTADTNFMHELMDFYKLKPQITFPKLASNSSLEKQLYKPEIQLKNVSFRYPQGQHTVLKNINLTISYGQNIALVGENGAGKTTLVKLLLRMYDPTEGKILINGINIKEFPEQLLYKTYSILFQSFGRFYLTIKENLQISTENKMTDGDMIKCLQFAEAWDFVKAYKNGLDQQLGPEYKEGTDLSGGQWQKLAIARAYAKKAPILILDEPTSAVDAKAEMEIFDRLNKQMHDNTLIFISHRFSTIKDAQRIVVMDKGKIVEDGNHQSLMDQRGKYATLYTIQAHRYQRA
jgi:ATP-binding cassette, subfamily B, bacterial